MLTVLLLMGLLLAGGSAQQQQCNVVDDCRADPTNRTISTAAIQACINKCLHGGEVIIPDNAAILISSIDLTGATDFALTFGRNSSLTAVPDPALYPLVPFLPFGNRLSWRPIVYGWNVSNVTIGGSEEWAAFSDAPPVLNGAGSPWWVNYTAKTLKYARPKLIELANGSDITIRDLHTRDSPNWSNHVYGSSGVNFLRLLVTAPRAVGNTDGIHPESCSHILIDSCHVDVGDDAITLTSSAWPNTTRCSATRHVLITNTTLLSRNMALGSQTYCGVYDVLMKGGRIGDDGNAQGIGSSPWALKIKQHQNQGGIASNITLDGVRIGRITPNPWQQSHGGWLAIFYMNYGMAEGLGDEEVQEAERAGTDEAAVWVDSTLADDDEPAPAPPPRMFDITFKNLVVTSAIIPAQLTGLPNSYITGLTFDNVTILDTSKTKPWDCRYVKNTTIIDTHPGPAPGTCGTPK